MTRTRLALIFVMIWVELIISGLTLAVLTYLTLGALREGFIWLVIAGVVVCIVWGVGLYFRALKSRVEIRSLFRDWRDLDHG
jgi:hypothetical protein